MYYQSGGEGNVSSRKKPLYSLIVKVIFLLLVIPATNANSECSFPAILKNYHHSTMHLKRLNVVMIVNVQNNVTDTLDVCSANEFCSSLLEKQGS